MGMDRAFLVCRMAARKLRVGPSCRDVIAITHIRPPAATIARCHVRGFNPPASSDLGPTLLFYFVSIFEAVMVSQMAGRRHRSHLYQHRSCLQHSPAPSCRHADNSGLELHHPLTDRHSLGDYSYVKTWLDTASPPQRRTLARLSNLYSLGGISGIAGARVEKSWRR
jgi:hypothetical protein